MKTLLSLNMKRAAQMLTAIVLLLGADLSHAQKPILPPPTAEELEEDTVPDQSPPDQIAPLAPMQLIVGPNVNVSKRAGYEAEVAIAVNPANPQNVFVLSNTSGSSMFGGVSNDGGATWSTRLVATGADGITAACCDPTLSADPFGNLFMGYINSATNAIVVTRSSNGGASFVPVATFSGSIDQPTVVTGPGSVWVTYMSGGSVVARGAAVTALGTVGAFNAEQISPSSSGGNFGDIVVGPGGKMAVTYQNPSGGQGPATIFASVDADGLGAGAFGPQRTVTTTNVGGFDFVPPQPNRSVDSEAGLAWDRTGGAHNNRLYMVYTEETVPENNDLDILVRFSDNDGATWSAPVRVNDDATVRTQMFPKMALDPVTGNIAVVWYDARNDAANKKVELWGTISTDGGQTFQPNVKISMGASDGTQANIGNPNEFGDYIGLTFYDNVFYAGWADSSNSTGDNPNGTTNLDLYVARVTLTNPDVMQVTPATGLTSAGFTGGPFTPSTQTYTLTNTGAASINWTASNTQPWVRLSAVGGTLAAGGSTTVAVTLRRGAATLVPGVYGDAVIFTNTTSGVGQTRPVNLTVSDSLTVSPAGGLTSSGPIGGPFTPSSQVYTLTNNSTVPLNWTATKSQPWLTLSAVGGTLAPGANTTISATINAAAAALVAGAYSDTVTIVNGTSTAMQLRPVSLTVNPPVPDYFTEIFDTTPNDTDNQSWLFTPNASISFYRVVRSPATAFPTDPTGGTALTLSDDSFVQVTPTGGVQVRLYGVSYPTFFVGSNGYVTFGAGDSPFTESLANHFNRPRIAALFDDLDPGSGGTVTWKQLADRVAVTFQNVPEFNAATTNSFQIEMFFDGRIRITCLAISATDGLIGFSRGLGTPGDFVESDFSTYPSFLLQVNPPGGLTANGLLGGPFTPSSQAYTLTNIGTVSLDWTAAKTQPWVNLSATGGTLAPGANTTVTVALNAAAAALALGTYSDTVTFAETTSGLSQTRPVSLTVSDSLGVSPASGLTAAGPGGGPFTPASQVYTLTNNGPVSLNWTATKTQTWLSLSAAGGTLAPGANTNVTVALNAAASALAIGAYSDTVTITNTSTNVIQTRPVSLNVNPLRPDYFTEIFDTTPNDTDNQSWLFTPNGSTSFYRVVRSPAAAFPTAPTGGTTLILSDDSSVQVTPTGGAQVAFYGVSYPAFFVGSNGYVTFGSGDSSRTETLTAHFSNPRIAALFDDINPASAGNVTWKQLADRVAVTFQNVPEFSTTNANSFQIEMFFDGRIRITCLAIAATDGLIGLSRGLGLPADFVESDFSTYPAFIIQLNGPGTVTEGDAPVTGTVTALAAPADDVVVNLASSDTSEATVPATVTILAGETSATFPITILDDTDLDGTQDVSITATATDYATTPATLAVKDNETPAIRLTPYEEWIVGKGLSGPDSDHDADFDQDGVANLLEWAFGTHPKISSPGTLSVIAGTITRGGPTSLVVDDGLGGVVPLAAFPRRKDYAEEGLIYILEFSSDLATWTASADTPAAIADDGEIEIVTVPYPPLIDGQIAAFFRIKVTDSSEEDDK